MQAVLGLIGIDVAKSDRIHACLTLEEEPTYAPFTAGGHFCGPSRVVVRVEPT